MDPVSLTLDVVGLFSTCMDLLDRYDNFKAFGQDSRQLFAMFEADKKRLQDWALSAGISRGKLEENHNPLLDEPERAMGVEVVLKAICDILDTGEQMEDRLKVQSARHQANTSASPHDFPTQAMKYTTEKQASVKARLSWTIRWRGRFAIQIEMLQKLLDRLYNLVPPPNDRRSGSLRHGGSIANPNDDATLPTNIYTLLSLELQGLLQETRVSARRQAMKDAEEWFDAPMTNELDDHSDHRLEGTCEWIFAHPAFEDWMQDGQDSMSKLLWLNSGPGMGKLVTCTHARAGGKPREIARSWLSQLARQNNDALDTIRGYMLTKHAGKRALQSIVWDMLEDILHGDPQHILIMDGFDEYDRDDDDNRALFLTTLKSRVKSTNSRVLLVSRDIVDIRSGALSRDGEDTEGWSSLNLRISNEDLNADLKQFSLSVVNQKLQKKDPLIRQDIAHQMASKCEGMFLWIKLQQQYLRGSKSRRELERTVNSMPTDLNKTYARSWKAIQEKDEDERNRAIAILRWVAFALRPLTVTELTDALLISVCSDNDSSELIADGSPEDIDDEYIVYEIKDICESLVDVLVPETRGPPGCRVVQFVHFSVREFLVLILLFSYQFPTPTSPLSTESCHHVALAVTCLRYLNTPSVWETWGNGDEQSTPRSFVDYASSSWYVHYRANSDVLLHLCRQFFRADNVCFRRWCDHFESLNPPEEDDPQDVSFGVSSPMYYAALLGLAPLLECSSDDMKRHMNRSTGRLGSPLSTACYNGHLEAFQRLLDLGADINIEVERFGNALNAALSAGHKEMAMTLLARGARHDARDCDGRNSVYIACREGLSEVAQLLLLREGDVNRTGPYGDTALEVAARYGHLETVSMLLQNGADMTLPDEEGFTPLYNASRSGHPDIVRVLLDGGADPNLATKGEETPLFVATYNGHTKIVQLLLDAGADLNVANMYGTTSLWAASFLGHIEIVRLLLDAGVNPNLGTRYGSWTPLWAAFYGGHIEIVQLLLDAGADPNLIPTDEQTPLEVARHEGHTKVIQLLLAAGAESEPDDTLPSPP